MAQVPVVQFRGLRPDPGCKIFHRVISSEKQAVRSEERRAVFLIIFINVVKRKKMNDNEIHNGGTLGVGGFFEEFHPRRPRPGCQNNCNSPALSTLTLR